MLAAWDYKAASPHVFTIASIISTSKDQEGNLLLKYQAFYYCVTLYLWWFTYYLVSFKKTVLKIFSMK